MHLLLILSAWILGISTMGFVLEDHHYFKALISYRSWIWGLTPAVFILTYFKSGSHHTRTTLVIILKIVRLGLILLSVFLLGQHYAQSQLQQRLQHRITEVRNSTEIIYIDQLDEASQAHGHTNIKQQAIKQPVRWAASKLEHQHSKLLLYLNDQADQQALVLGQYYRVTGNIKPAHSYAVPHVFDQEKWLIQQNIMGTMQVKYIEPIAPQMLIKEGYNDFVSAHSGVMQSLQLSAEKLRLHFRELIDKQPLEHKGLMLALLTGDESLLSEEIQNQFKSLGISHLLAISGPHVLVFAVIVCFLLNMITSTYMPSIFLKIPRPYWLILPFVSCVLAYTAFVGFEIPALRTCLTVCLISFVLLLKQQIQALKLLLLSASLLLLIDPLSILSAAFWLSYGACFILIRVYQTLVQQRAEVSEHQSVSAWKKFSLMVQVLIESQWKVFIALFPLVALVFGQVSWLSPVVNVLSIPLIGAVIVPLEVIGAVLSTFFTPLGLLFFHLADFAISFLMGFLNVFSQVFQPQLRWLAFTPLMIVMMSIGILILFLPKGTVPKLWSIVCFIPLLLGSKHQSDVSLSVLDIGQGQAIFLNLPDHKMMIDVGGSFDETQFSVAERIVLPYLMGEGISTLDHVLLTHLDQDHAGAFEKLNQSIKIKQVSSNQRDQRFQQSNFQYCHAGQAWHYPKVNIQVLAPDKNSLSKVPYSQNELSCIVYIQIPQAKGMQSFLLMGDAGWEAEYQLMHSYPNLKVDVLVLGHHGSRHSSSYAFLKHYHPKLTIASAGFNNRYGHPHPITIARLKALSIPFESTIEQGSIMFELQDNGEMRERHHRQSRAWLMR